MRRYRLLIDRRALKFVEGLEAKHFKQVVRRILALSEDPRPHDSEQLTDFEDPERRGREGFRVDQGEYRILYAFDPKAREVQVFVVGNRKDVYRAL